MNKKCMIVQLIVLLSAALALADDHHNNHDCNHEGTHHVSSWKQCSWRNINANKNVGIIKECPFYKKRTHTHLRIVWTGSLRQLISGRCARWYFTFNNRECARPHPVEGVVYSYPNINIQRVSTIEGYCGGVPAGIVSVRFNVGRCLSHRYPGHAYTGWNSVSRIVVEEVEPPQP